jgi:hypothetical protein
MTALVATILTVLLTALPAALQTTSAVKITGAPPFPALPDSIETTDRQITTLRDNALQWYLQAGYPFAAVVMYFSSPETLVVNTVPGRHALLEEIRFPDSVRTSSSILLRETGIQPGDLYDPEPVNRWLTALQRYPFIESAGPAVVALGPGGNIVLLVPVQEAPPGWFSGDLDFSSTGGFTGGGEIVFTSIFGTGRRLELAASAVKWGGVDASGLYMEPWILGSPVSARAEIQQQVPDSGSVIREWSGSVILSLGNVSISGGGGTWKSWPANKPDESFRYGSAGIEVDFTTSCRQGRSGFRGSITTKAGSAAGADSTYLLTRAETHMSYNTYTGMFGTGASLNAGGIVSGEWLASMVTRLGGYGSLRGYVKDSFRAGAWGIVSPEVSLGETQTQLYLFSDMGILRAAEKTRYPISTGIGIRGTTGGLRFDAGSAFPLNQGTSSARFYFSAVISL